MMFELGKQYDKDDKFDGSVDASNLHIGDIHTSGAVCGNLSS